MEFFITEEREKSLKKFLTEELRLHGCDGALTTPTIAVQKAAIAAMRRAYRLGCEDNY